MSKKTVKKPKEEFSFQPLGGNIVVQQTEAEEVSEGGILIPEKSRTKPREGTVVATGPGKVLENGETLPVHVSPGDHVIFASFGGTEVVIEGVEYLILGQEEILGRVI